MLMKVKITTAAPPLRCDGGGGGDNGGSSQMEYTRCFPACSIKSKLVCLLLCIAAILILP